MKTTWQPTLSDEAVILKPLEVTDFEALYQVANDPALWEQHPARDRYKREVFRSFFDDAISSQGAFLITDLKNGEVIGSSRYKPVEGVDSAVEIGWSFLATAYWGTGMNRRIKQLMLNYAFWDLMLGATRISDFHLPLVKESPQDYTYLISRQHWLENRML